MTLINSINPLTVKVHPVIKQLQRTMIGKAYSSSEAEESLINARRLYRYNLQGAKEEGKGDKVDTYG